MVMLKSKQKLLIKSHHPNSLLQGHMYTDLHACLWWHTKFCVCVRVSVLSTHFTFLISQLELWFCCHFQHSRVFCGLLQRRRVSDRSCSFCCAPYSFCCAPYSLLSHQPADQQGEQWHTDLTHLELVYNNFMEFFNVCLF